MGAVGADAGLDGEAGGIGGRRPGRQRCPRPRPAAGCYERAGAEDPGGVFEMRHGALLVEVDETHLAHGAMNGPRIPAFAIAGISR